MKISLKVLNTSFQFLEELTKQKTPKGQESVSFRLGRFKEDADAHISRIQKMIRDTSMERGFVVVGQGMILSLKEGAEISRETIEDFNDVVDKFLRETIEEIGPPHYRKFHFEEIALHWETTGETFAKLSWLIDAPTKESENLAQAEKVSNAVA